MKQSLYLCMILFFSSFLIACTPVKLPPNNTYVINALPGNVTTARRQHGIILVSAPDTLPIYNTTEMAYSKYPYQIAYFSENKWGATPSEMMLPLLVQTLQKTHAFKAVVTSSYLGNYDDMLSTQIVDLRQTFTHHQARVVLSVIATLNGKMDARIIATKRFDVVLSMRCISPYDGVRVTNEAMAILLKQIAAFCVHYRGA